MGEAAHYTPVTVWPAEGVRVGLVTCRRCGAAILLDPRDEDGSEDRTALGIHDAWHEGQEDNDA